MMKEGKSSLNPDAPSYVPLHKREANDRNKVSMLITRDSLSSGDETARSISPTHSHHGTQKCFQATASDSDIHGKGHLIGSGILLEGHENLSDRTAEQYIDEPSELDLDILADLFPKISKQSITDVYAVNEGDFEASVDMLFQLEDDVPEDLLHVECTESSSSKAESFFFNEASAS